MSEECDLCGELTLGCHCEKMTCYQKWEKSLINFMESKGWEMEKNDENMIRFCLTVSGHRWISEYDKKTTRFTSYDE